MTDTPGVATASTDGNSPAASASRETSPEVSTHRPSRAMPIGNLTAMTDAERGKLGAWIAAGVP